MTGPEQFAAGERAEAAGDFLAATAAYRALTTATDPAVAADAFFRLGRVSWRQGRYPSALSAFESARALALRTEDRDLVARVDNGIGAVHYARGDYADARRAYASASDTTTDPVMRGKIIMNLGVIANIEGRLDDALEQYEHAFALLETLGDSSSAMLALHNRGMVEADLGRWDEADASFREALARATEAQLPEMIAKTLVNRTEVLVQRGDLDEAVDHCNRALGIYSVVGDEVGRAEALRWKGHTLRLQGKPALAERNVQEALYIAMRAGARLLEAEAAREMGVLRAAQSDPSGASKHLTHALQLFETLGAVREAAAVRALLDS